MNIGTSVLGNSYTSRFDLSSYSERSDLRFKAFFVKETKHVIK
jgi:hypothetical protein